MNKEKDFFKTCFNTVAGLEVRNESQAIAKEVVLSEIENLQQENKQLKAKLEMYENGVYYSSENDKLKDVIEEVREYIKYYLLDNSWFKDSQNEFKKLLQILDKAKERINNTVRKD